MIQCLLSGFNGITVYCQFNRICQNRRRADQYKKSVDLSAQITIFKKWLKMGKNRTLKNGDRPTFFKKTLQKWWVWEIMAITNGVNAVVVPCLWGIDTFYYELKGILLWYSLLYLAYEGLTRSHGSGTELIMTSLYLAYEGLAQSWLQQKELEESVVPCLWGIDT